jgi:hypothetical protein
MILTLLIVDYIVVIFLIFTNRGFIYVSCVTLLFDIHLYLVMLLGDRNSWKLYTLSRLLLDYGEYYADPLP